MRDSVISTIPLPLKVQFTYTPGAPDGAEEYGFDEHIRVTSCMLGDAEVWDFLTDEQKEAVRLDCLEVVHGPF